MSVAGRGKERKGRQDRSDVVRRDVLKGLCCAAAAVAAAPVVRGAKVWAALSPPAGELETRALGATGVRVATVGMGAMITRDSDVIRYAVDHGVNYVDTANCYMGGENERIVGRALEGIRDKVVLASKVHIAPVDQMITSVENSLRSLKTDVIDIMQLHGIKSEGEVADESAREALQKLLDQGKIRVPGVTTHSGQEEVLSAVGKQEFYRTVLVAYNFRSDTGIKAAIKNVFGSGKGLSATIRETAAKGIGIIAMKTQAGGYAVPQGSLSPHQAAIAWVLENPGVATTIPSMVSFSQVDENVLASGKRLGWGGRKALTQYAQTIGDRHCGLCGGCAGSCPSGVDVPSVLRSLTYLEGYGRKDLALGSYRGLGPDRGALPCLSCGSCAVSCRLGLDVKRLARRAHRHLA
ncbi:MAG: aldo/keto reductase [Deltaproteobacteria bacterium]|nr:aldo/keto reductase [Deltaproteobacteria bacterium]